MPKKKTVMPDEGAADERTFDDATTDDTVIVEDTGLVPAEDAAEPIPDDLETEEEWQDDEDISTNPSYLDDISDDSVRLYLREIGKIPLLKPEEELALAHRV